MPNKERFITVVRVSTKLMEFAVRYHEASLPAANSSTLTSELKKLCLGHIIIQMDSIEQYRQVVIDLHLLFTVVQ